MPRATDGLSNFKMESFAKIHNNSESGEKRKLEKTFSQSEFATFQIEKSRRSKMSIWTSPSQQEDIFAS
jgi:phosphoserine aminotransferase